MRATEPDVLVASLGGESIAPPGAAVSDPAQHTIIEAVVFAVE